MKKAKLIHLKLWETPDNYFEYFEEGSYSATN
jgi:hypothetical protein